MPLFFSVPLPGPFRYSTRVGLPHRRRRRRRSVRVVHVHQQAPAPAPSTPAQAAVGGIALLAITALASVILFGWPAVLIWAAFAVWVAVVALRRARERAAEVPLVTPEEHANTCEKLRAAELRREAWDGMMRARAEGNTAEEAMFDELWQIQSRLARMDRDGLPER